MKKEVMDALFEEYLASLTDLEAATVLAVAERLGMKDDLVKRLEADGWEVE